MKRRFENIAGAGGLQSLRARNRDAVLRALEHGVSLSQRELAGQTGLSEATVSNLTALLVESGEVLVTTGLRNGRRANLLSRTVRQDDVVIGVDASRSRFRALALHADGTVERGRIVERVGRAKYEDDLVTIKDLIDELLPARRTVSSIGIAFGITVDSLTGRMVPDTSRTAEIPWFPSSWREADPAADLTAHYGVPALALNDGDAAVVAEARRGAAAGQDDVFYVHLGDGVGGGLVLNGRLYRGGEGGFATEIGHLSSDRNGRLCFCGNRGCLELLFGDALLSQVEDVHGRLSLERFAELAAAGDPACVSVLREVAESLAAGLANAVALVTPSRLVVGGPLAAAGEALIGPLQDVARRHGFGQFWRGKVVLSTLGDDNVGIGAALASTEYAGDVRAS